MTAATTSKSDVQITTTDRVINPDGRVYTVTSRYVDGYGVMRYKLRADVDRQMYVPASRLEQMCANGWVHLDE